MKKTSTAGSAPAIINSRQPSPLSRYVARFVPTCPQLTQQFAHAIDEVHQHQAQQTDEQHADVGGGADQPSEKRPRTIGPDLGDQRHAERPFAAHAERRDESQHGDVPGLAGESAQAGENRVGDDAERHRANAADAIAEPAEQHAAGGRADQKDRHDHAEPFAFERGIGGEFAVQQLVECRRADQREHADLEAVEHPAQQRGDERHPFAAFVGRGGGARIACDRLVARAECQRNVYASSQPRSVAKSVFSAARLAAASPLGRYST